MLDFIFGDSISHGIGEINPIHRNPELVPNQAGIADLYFFNASFKFLVTYIFSARNLLTNIPHRFIILSSL